jgi:adenine-specific DNA-methyltransferase
MPRFLRSGYAHPIGKSLMWKCPLSVFPYTPLTNVWTDIQAMGFGDEKLYVVWTQTEVVQRCLLMTTDPGDLVLDPTCGSGTT